MRKYAECEVVGMEVVRGENQVTKKAYTIVKLHCTYTLPYDGSDRYEGEGVLTATCSKAEADNDKLGIGSLIQCVEAYENGYRRIEYFGKVGTAGVF